MFTARSGFLDDVMVTLLDVIMAPDDVIRGFGGVGGAT